MLKQNDIKEIYEQTLLTREPVLLPDDIQLQYIQKFLPDCKEAVILDAGCGNGNYTRFLVKNGYIHVHAVDLFDTVAADGFAYRQASIDSLPFEDGFFDFIYSNSVIFYLNNPEDGVREFGRVLKKDGIVLITAHTKYSLFTGWRIIKRALGLKSLDHLKSVRFYSANEYAKMFKENNFDVILIDGYRLSILIYPMYRKMVRLLEVSLGVRLPLLSSSITKNSVLSQIKSVFAYHSIVVARKKEVLNKLG